MEKSEGGNISRFGVVDNQCVSRTGCVRVDVCVSGVLLVLVFSSEARGTSLSSALIEGVCAWVWEIWERNEEGIR